MKKIDFQTLLTDLYLLYNPSKVNDVNFLIEKYAGQEYDAVQMFYIKYNQKNHTHYNSNVTEEFIQSLIESYNKKDRVLSPENIVKNQPVKVDQEEIEKKLKEEREKEIQVNEKIKEEDKQKLTEEIENNLRNKITKEITEELSKEFSKEKQKDYFNNFEINVSNYYEDSEVSLPEPMILLYMGIGGKFICRNKERKIIPLCVQDITMDFVTDTERPTIEIIVNEARLND